MSDNRELFQLQARLSEIDGDIRQANGRKRSGGIAMLIAVIGTLILFPLFPLWGLIGIAGLLAYGTNASKLNALKAERRELVAGA